MHYLLLSKHLQEYPIYFHSKQNPQCLLTLRLILLRHALAIQQFFNVLEEIAAAR